MEATIKTRTCGACGHPLKGRTDKKFCDDSCRNQHNNGIRAREDLIIRETNKILKMNRRILQSLVPDGSTSATTSFRQLQFMGFNFNYSTHSYSNGPDSFLFCYDHGYLIAEQGKVLLIRGEADPFLMMARSVYR
jgi:hypothetical protein